MIDVRDAVGLGQKYLIELLKDTELAEVPPKEVVPEEVELSEDEKLWRMAFCYPVREPEGSEPVMTPASESVRRFLQNMPRRKYKVVTVNAEDGRLISIKIPA